MTHALDVARAVDGPVGVVDVVGTHREVLAEDAVHGSLVVASRWCVVARDEQVRQAVAVDVSARTQVGGPELALVIADPACVRGFDGDDAAIGQIGREVQHGPAAALLAPHTVGTVCTDQDVGASVPVYISCTGGRPSNACPRCTH